jgi:charged multivesicular body protein 7
MLEAIDRARDNVAMVRAMEASSKVLKELHAETGGVEHVADVADALGEQMGNVDEITSILTEPGAGSVDEVEVEDEFEEMLQAERAKETKKLEEEEFRQKEAQLRELEEWERKKREEAQKEAQREQLPQEEKVEQEVEKRREEIEEMHLE